MLFRELKVKIFQIVSTVSKYLFKIFHFNSLKVYIFSRIVSFAISEKLVKICLIRLWLCAFVSYQFEFHENLLCEFL